MRAWIAAAAAALAFALPALAGGGKAEPHPHFDDKGTLSWSTKAADVQAAAKKAGKLIFIEYGREA